MTSIVFTAEGADAHAEVNGKLTAGMVGVTVQFQLDRAWEGLNIIATFEGSGALISVPLLSYMEGAVPLNVQAYRVIDTDVPWEVLQKANTRLRIGLEGRLVDGTIVIPTVWARAGYIEAGALATGEEANQPTPGIYDQIMAAIEAGQLQGEPGFSPTVSVTDIEGGHRVTITDANGTQVFDVMDGSGFDIEIADDLYTKDSTKALSARQGAILREKIDDDILSVQKELQAEIKQRVKTVNGIAPDENGNVNVEGGSGGNGGGIAVETDPTVPAWAKQPNKPTYTASEVGALPASTVIPAVPTKVSAFENDKGYLTDYTETDPTVPAWAKATTKPSYSKSEVGLSNVDNVKQYSASNPPPYPVTSVNGKTGTVTLDASAVGARPSTWMPSASDVGALPASTTIPTKVSQLTNDSGFIKGYTETDPTVPSWAKASTKPSYSKSEVGLGNVDNVKQYSASNPPPYPVTSVNGQTGAVTVNVPTKVSQLTNDKGYLTQHQDISGKVDKAGLSLGRHADGLLYVFVDGQPVGDGVDLPTGGIDGYITPDKQIVFNNLPDGEYTLAYINDDGSIVPIGAMEKDTNVYYTVTNTLTQCTTNNSATKAVQGGSYSAIITAKSGYELESVTVTMGGSPVSVSGGNISIANVTGNIVITAVATEVQAAEPTNFAEPNTTNKTDWSIWCNDARFGSDGAYRSLAGNVVTNYIPIKVGDTLRFTGLSVATTGTSMNNGLAYYTEDKVIIAPSYWYWFADDNNAAGDLADTNVTDGVYTITLTDDFGKYVNGAGKKGTETAYVRISGTLTGSVDDVAINVKRNGTWL